MKVKREILEEMCWDDIGEEFNGIMVVAREFKRKARWFTEHWLVVAIGDRFGRIILCEPATESQEMPDGPFNSTDDTLTLEEVFPKEIKKTIYRPSP